MFATSPPTSACTHAGEFQLLAGVEGEPGYRDGPGPEARFNCPTAACALPGGSGALVVADSQNACIRLVDRGGNVSTLAGACGEQEGHRDGPGREALFARGMRSLVCLDNCSVLVGDASNGRLRQGCGQQQEGLCGACGEGANAPTRRFVCIPCAPAWRTACPSLPAAPLPLNAAAHASHLCRRIDVSGTGCPAPPDHPHRVSPLTIAAIWLLGGGAVLVAAMLAVRRWAADRAEVAQQRMREACAAHAVSAVEAGIAQVGFPQS